MMKKVDYLLLLYSVLLLIFGFGDEPKRDAMTAHHDQSIILTISAVHASTGESPGGQLARSAVERQHEHKSSVTRRKF